MSLFGLVEMDPKVDAGLDIQKMVHNHSNDKNDVEARRQDLGMVSLLTIDRPQGLLWHSCL